MTCRVKTKALIFGPKWSKMALVPKLLYIAAMLAGNGGNWKIIGGIPSCQAKQVQ